MALIPVVGRKSLQMRALIGALYLILSLGAVTMAYPFLVMLGASVTSQYDQNEYRILPRYLFSTRALFGKYAEDKFRADITQINAAYGTNFVKLEDVAPPSSASPVSDWDAFAQSLPARYKTAGFGGATAAFSPSPLLDRYHQFLRARFHDDIRALDRAYNQEDETFLTVFPPFEQPAKRNWTPDQSSVKNRDWTEFQQTLPPHYFVIVGADPIYQKWLKEEAYASLSDLNKAWGGKGSAWTDIALPARPGGNTAQRKDWETFVRTKLPFRQVRMEASAQSAYDAFLAARYKNDIAALNARQKTAWASFANIPLPDPDSVPAAGAGLLDWLDFLKSAAPLAALSADTVETRWRANRTSPDARLPLAQADAAYVQAHTSELRRGFLGRNYALVLQFIVLHGRAVGNTALFCALAVLTALIVNPLCAYALSRYNLPYGNALLLFLLATLAFPAEVALIPNFLLLKDLGLLNTFAALILPGAASGFYIFMMKGFFDSLPKELYEAGTLDGASEARLFTTITLPLSKPIFAVIALGAFTSAYSAFLFALLVCQRSEKWTMMVWLYELQSNSAPQYVMMAALTLAAIPTLLVFIFAQNTIMKGIILPSFK